MTTILRSSELLSPSGKDLDSSPKNSLVDVKISIPSAWSTGEESPENQLIMFIKIITTVEKAANWLGKLIIMLPFMMVVRVFKITPQSEDFWFIIVIMLLESIRKLCCGRGPELHHQATWPEKAQHRRAQKAQLLSANNALGPRWVRTIQLVLIGLQHTYKLILALTCGILSVIQLISQNSGQTEDWDIKIFKIYYVIVLAQQVILLAEMIFWRRKVSSGGLFKKVNAECGLDKSDSDMISIMWFTYYAYTKSLSGNIFYDLKLDLVIFAQECLDSGTECKQLIGVKSELIGARILRADFVLRNIRKTPVLFKQLIDMLNWGNTPSEKEDRYSIALILSELAEEKANAQLVAEIPGAMIPISNLLDSSSTTVGHKDSSLDFNLLGLSLLWKLAKEHKNCANICNTDGLLTRIINFTSIGQHIDSQVVMMSLQVLNMLAGTPGKTGLECRQKISEVVLMFINIREILCYGFDDLKKLALEVLTKLAMEREARIRFGKTGKLANELVRLFFRPGEMCNQNVLRAEAGNALAMLILENRDLCDIILYDERERILDKLTKALEDPVIFVSSSRILHNLCATAGPELSIKLGTIVAGFPMVSNAIMANMEKNESAKVKSLEISLGLAVQMLKFMRPAEFTTGLRIAFLPEEHLVKRLVRIIAANGDPSAAAPQIRQFAIKLTVEMMKIDKTYVKLFKDAEIVRKLRGMTRLELKNINFVSENVWQINHHVSFDSLLDEAFELLR